MSHPLERTPGCSKLESVFDINLFGKEWIEKLKISLKNVKHVLFLNRPTTCKSITWHLQYQRIPYKNFIFISQDPIPGRNQLIIIVLRFGRPLRRATAESAISTLKDICTSISTPTVLVSDNGPQFTSYMFAKFCLKLGIHHIRTTPFFPAANIRSGTPTQLGFNQPLALLVMNLASSFQLLLSYHPRHVLSLFLPSQIYYLTKRRKEHPKNLAICN